MIVAVALIGGGLWFNTGVAFSTDAACRAWIGNATGWRCEPIRVPGRS